MAKKFKLEVEFTDIALMFKRWTKLTNPPDVKSCINVIRCPLCGVHFPPRIHQPDFVKWDGKTLAVTGCDCPSATGWQREHLNQLLKGVVRL